MPELPSWLVDHIATKTGAPPGARFVVRRRCTSCRALVLVGPDFDFAAVDATVDPEPLVRPVEEARVVIAGRATYALRRHGRRLFLTRRDHWQMKRTPAGSQPTSGARGYVIVADHACREEE